MEQLQLNTHSEKQLKAYLKENSLTHYESAIANDLLLAIKNNNLEKLEWFRSFGNSFRTILMNIISYQKSCEFGFSDVEFDKYGWIKRPEFLCKEDLIFGNELKFGEYSKISIGCGFSNIWTYALNYGFGTAGGGSALSVFGKQFKNRDAAVKAGLCDLKKLMKEKLGHSDRSNYKQPIIIMTLRDIAKAENEMLQLSLF